MIRLLCLTLALLIAVTSQQMAMARAATHDAAGQVILCTGQGVVTVTLDANGEPMGPVHICPDCALTLMLFADVPAVGDAQVVHIQTLAQTPVAALGTPIIHKATHARDPPLIV